MAELSDPQVSPDGQWVAYVVETANKEDDKAVSQIWMTNWAGSEDLQLTYATESSSSPRWSPDGRYLSFVSSRENKEKTAQLWLLDRRGGEALQLTHFKDQEITAYHWSPDASKLVLVMKEREDAGDHDDSDKPKPPKPLVIDRYHFKQDMEGYLSGKKRNHLYLFDVAGRKLEQLTQGDHDETNAVWSPDGRYIAYTSSLDPDVDRTLNSDVFVIEPHAGASGRRLTTYEGPDSGPLSWSPDGQSIAYLQGVGGKYSAYSMDRLALVSLAGKTRLLAQKMDRGVSHPTFSQDGHNVLVIVDDDRSDYPAAVDVSTGSTQKLLSDPGVVSDLSARAEHTAVVRSTDGHPAEIFALEGSMLRPLTHHNDGWIRERQLASVEDISFRSTDSAEVHGLVVKPAGFEAGKRYPTLLRIHGGPDYQDSHEFRFDDQILAAAGYVVLHVNYRGSSGRGEEYGRTIAADWGHKEVADLLAGVEAVVKAGVADPERLGIGGWSYGGILTDYSIASDHRFKAAISGAGSANWFGIYGIDEYTYQYDHELGYPWKNPDAWIKLSYPFFHADRIRTPTLFMGGDKDFNVPIAGGEQMYQALQTLGVPSQLVVYPGEFHEFERPSFIRDRYERDLAWYGKYVK